MGTPEVTLKLSIDEAFMLADLCEALKGACPDPALNSLLSKVKGQLRMRAKWAERKAQRQVSTAKSAPLKNGTKGRK